MTSGLDSCLALLCLTLTMRSRAAWFVLERGFLPFPGTGELVRMGWSSGDGSGGMLSSHWEVYTRKELRALLMVAPVKHLKLNLQLWLCHCDQ